VLQQDFKVFETETIYDQIICNPPFFKNSHKGQSASKNTAIHDDDLPMVTLINRSEKLLSSQGSLWVMYPEYEMKQFTLLASESGFSLCQQTAIYNQADKPVFRVVAQFSKAQPNKSISLELIIKEADGSYTKKFTHLLKEYYLHL